MHAFKSLLGFSCAADSSSAEFESPSLVLCALALIDSRASHGKPPSVQTALQLHDIAKSLMGWMVNRQTCRSSTCAVWSADTGDSSMRLDVTIGSASTDGRRALRVNRDVEHVQFNISPLESRSATVNAILQGLKAKLMDEQWVRHMWPVAKATTLASFADTQAGVKLLLRTVLVRVVVSTGNPVGALSNEFHVPVPLYGGMEAVERQVVAYVRAKARAAGEALPEHLAICCKCAGRTTSYNTCTADACVDATSEKIENNTLFTVIEAPAGSHGGSGCAGSAHSNEPEALTWDSLEFCSPLLGLAFTEAFSYVEQCVSESGPRRRIAT